MAPGSARLGWQGRAVKNLPDRKSTKSKENMGIFVLRYAQLSVEVETALLRILTVFILFLADSNCHFDQKLSLHRISLEAYWISH